MHKIGIIPMALLMSLILGSGLAAFTSNTAFAQNYGYSDDYSYNNNNSYSDSSYSDSYSTYPTDDKPYECRTGPFEGFFTSSVEFCKNVKFDKDDRKDHRDRDNRTGTQGPQGPRGPSTINTTNVYTNVGTTNNNVFTGGFASSIANCDLGDTALSGSFVVGASVSTPTAIAEIVSSKPLPSETGWNATAFGESSGQGFVTADVECFDNPTPTIHVP